MVILPKAAGGVRICCNLVDVNKAIIADCYPLPTMDNFGRVFNGAQYFSKLDVRGRISTGQLTSGCEAHDGDNNASWWTLHRRGYPWGCAQLQAAFKRSKHRC
jgi:hypothetical protein